MRLEEATFGLEGTPGMSLFENKRGQTAGAMAVKRLQDDIGAYLTEQDRELVQRAYVFAAKAHEGQFRLSGEDYIEHPVAVARSCLNWKGTLPQLLHCSMTWRRILTLRLKKYGKSSALR